MSSAVTTERTDFLNYSLTIGVAAMGGRGFYFHDPNGIYIQIALDTQPDPRVADDPDPTPSARKYLVSP